MLIIVPIAPPIAVLIATLFFNTTFGCIQHLDNQITNRPPDARVSYLGMTGAIINLYGAKAVLKCEGHVYRAWIMEDNE